MYSIVKKPGGEWILMLHLEKIDNILASDKAIRYVGIIDSTGNIVASKSRGGGGVLHIKMRYSDLTSVS
ncbi:MAG: hypothetical protein ACRDFB_10195 [Rhabdochlamydiaceae bacterium]